MKRANHLNSTISRCLVIVLVVLIGCVFQVLYIQEISAQSNDNDYIEPGKNLIVDGIPKIPKSLVKEVRKYTGAFGLPVAGWHPEKMELLLKGVSSETFITRVETPGGPMKSWLYINEAGIYDVYIQPQAKYLIYNKDNNGDEAYQMCLYNIESRKSTLLSDGKSRNTEFVWSNSGDRVVYSYAPPNSEGVSLSIINPFDPKSNRVLVKSTGSYLKAYDWSPDDRQIVYCEFYSNVASRLWMIDVVTGEKKLLSQQKEEDKYYDDPKFSKDGKGIYLKTDLGSDFKRLAYIDIQNKKISYLTGNMEWDVDEFELSPNGRELAFTTNEDGISHLYLIDTNKDKRKSITSLPMGIISGIKWHNNSEYLAFNFESPRTPNDVYVMNASTGLTQLWKKSFMAGVNPEKLAIPELIHWKSFDGRTISGFLYRPPSIFTDKRPVIIDIHGGPKDQHRPGYNHEDNLFINELGIAKVYPNIRGSSGYGSRFLDLDNGLKRVDAVKDIGALLDWIAKQSYLNANQILIQGDSYGGYVALSAAVAYGDRIRAVISEFGPSNLATFIESTGGWRRDLQRYEYGDEREIKTRNFLERIAPINNLHKMKKALFIIQGKNDPRVPMRESEAIVQKARKLGLNVWYLLANDEGHGFSQRGNGEFRLCSMILFVKEYLLG